MSLEWAVEGGDVLLAVPYTCDSPLCRACSECASTDPWPPHHLVVRGADDNSTHMRVDGESWFQDLPHTSTGEPPLEVGSFDSSSQDP